MNPLPLFIAAFTVATFLTAPAHAAKNPEPLAIGSAAPDFSLKGVDGKSYSLDDFADAKILAVLFTCNHCPSAQAAEERIKIFVTGYRDKGLALVAISPNNPEALRPEELGYSLLGDSYEDMVAHAKENGFNFPYLYDGDTQTTAKAYGCRATPHVFIFDAERKLRYKGRFDDSRFADPATVKSADAAKAVDALLAGEKVPVETTRAHGCSTKWAYKREEAVAYATKLDSTPVEVEVIDAAGVAALRKNDTGRIRMVNVWATWCAPCVAEFPDLVTVARKFGMRDFEFNPISLDAPKDAAKANAFLSKLGAAPPRKLKAALDKTGRKGTAFLWTGADTDSLAEALDPEWKGPVPYTLLIAPGGEILYRHEGPIDPDEVIRAIVGHMGRYYVPANP